MTKDEKKETIWHGRVFDFNHEEMMLPNGKNAVIEAIQRLTFRNTTAIELSPSS